jgi:hypothetical protein
MATIGVFRRVSSRVIEDLRAQPERIKSVLYPQQTETAIDDDVRVDVDSAWHALHFLLTGSPKPGKPPLDFILGGTPVGDIDLGEGPARMFTSAEVRKIAAGLALVNRQTLRSRFDPAQLTEHQIYPLHWDQPGTSSSFELIAEHFDALKDFVTTTAQAEAGMIVYML